jgi:hypothetical protein
VINEIKRYCLNLKYKDGVSWKKGGSIIRKRVRRIEVELRKLYRKKLGEKGKDIRRIELIKERS